MKVRWEERRLKNHVSCLVLALLLTGMLTAALKIQPVSANGTIYIRADGSIDPSNASISTLDNVTYTLTDSIVVDVPERTSASARVEDSASWCKRNYSHSAR
jgi:hypothetical protein